MQFVLIVMRVRGGCSVYMHPCVCVCVRSCKIIGGLSVFQCNGQLEQKSAGPSSLSVCLITGAHTHHIDWCAVCCSLRTERMKTSSLKHAHTYTRTHKLCMIYPLIALLTWNARLLVYHCNEDVFRRVTVRSRSVCCWHKRYGRHEMLTPIFTHTS